MSKMLNEKKIIIVRHFLMYDNIRYFLLCSANEQCEMQNKQRWSQWDYVAKTEIRKSTQEC